MFFIFDVGYCGDENDWNLLVIGVGFEVLVDF